MKREVIYGLIAIGVVGGAGLEQTYGNSAVIDVKPVAPDTTGNAQMVIEEFADFECGFCAQGSQTLKDVVRSYGGHVKIVFKNFPLPMHQHALKAAQAFLAAQLQDVNEADAFAEDLFVNQGKLHTQGENYLYAAAASHGLDVTRLKVDMSSGTVAQMLAREQGDAAKLHIRATPSFLIGSEFVEGARSSDDFKRIIDGELKKL